MGGLLGQTSYVTMGDCCVDRFGTGNCKQNDECPVDTPAPPVAASTLVTPTPTPCECTMLDWTYRNGECIRGCGISNNGQYSTRRACCMDKFGDFDSSCNSNDTCCDCSALPYAYVGGRCIRGCGKTGLLGQTAYDTLGECCVDRFGTGNCRTDDECPADPTPAPTAEARRPSVPRSQDRRPWAPEAEGHRGRAKDELQVPRQPRPHCGKHLTVCHWTADNVNPRRKGIEGRPITGVTVWLSMLVGLSVFQACQ